MLIKAPINLILTETSGQTSQPPWYLANKSYMDLVEIDNNPILFKVYQDKEGLDFQYELPLNSNFELKDSIAINKLKTIFDLDFNLDKFYKFLANDERLYGASSFCNGLRLFIAKNKFECILSSICSANNSIARWTKSITTIKEKFGKPIEFPSGTFYTFPSLSAIGCSFLDEFEEYDYYKENIDLSKCNSNLKSCGVGYRAAYMKSASEIFTLEMDLHEIGKMSYDEAFETVLEIPGVGPKVADCILLYGYNFKEAFPTDVWIKRIVSYLYFENKDIPVSKIREFGIEEFGDYGGYVQLYLFHYARQAGLMEKLKKKK